MILTPETSIQYWPFGTSSTPIVLNYFCICPQPTHLKTWYVTIFLKKLTIFNFPWLKLAYLYVQIAIKMLLLWKIWLIGTQENNDQMIPQRLEIANMNSFIQGNCLPKSWQMKRWNYEWVSKRRKKGSEKILNIIFFF